jgi:hypothetical protein
MLDLPLARLAETLPGHDSLFLLLLLVNAHVPSILQWPLWQSVDQHQQL